MTVTQQENELVPEADSRSAWLEAAAAGLVTRSERPLNAELPPHALGGDLTPTDQFFRRNHFGVPELAEADWRLRVGGLVQEPLELGVADLKRLGRQSTVATLECAGNGRNLFSPPVEGAPWDLGAVSSARWTGVPLADVLDLAAVAPRASELVFRGADSGIVDDVAGAIRYERSLSVPDAVAAGALLVYEMNGEPLPARHGFPVRLVVPGWYAVASVKWLTDIEVTDEPFTGYFQDTHYVYEWQRDGRRVREPVRLQRVRTLITTPVSGHRLPVGGLDIGGVAWSGSAPVTRVEVAVGDGPWQAAHLVGEPEAYGWQRWELPVAGLPSGPALIRARAYDAAGHDQRTAPEWNFLGYGGNFVHEVTVTLR